MQQMKMGIIPTNTLKKEKKDPIAIGWKEITKTKLNFDVEQCLRCKTGKMIRISCFDAHAPPLHYMELIKKQSDKK
jgi:hypothetical protein